MRRTLAITLLVTFLLALLAPVRAAWSCPDGTPCVHQHGGFVCVEKKCAAEASSCCIQKTVRCTHGAGPALEGAPSRRPGFHAPDHCRFRVSARPQLTAVTESASVFWLAAPAVLPAPVLQFSLLPAQPVWRSEVTLGYRPPPLLSQGPSRAPPHA